MSDFAFARDQIKERLRLSDIVGRKVAFDRRKSQPARGDYWACCPFHGEKTPSFHVVDATGYYHCFGCHESGDHFTFLMQMENRPFGEVLEMLAKEAGVELPARSAEAVEAARASATLHDILELAADFFVTQLERPGSGAMARAYVERRGISAAAVASFRLGYAPKGGRALIEHLEARAIPIADMRRAGLLASREEPRDLLTDRLVIPITDGRGRVVAFGGRALGPDQTIKYLNSPETPLFVKGRTLFNLAAARRRSAGADGPAARLILAEGYMDVIALAEAGFARAVAPLGTALTEDQLKAAFAIEDEPIVCFDGDRAGQAAARRALERALPLLAPGKSLRLAFLPEGQDPDDLLRAKGAKAMAEVLAAALPLAEALYGFHTEGLDLALPDARARAEAALKADVALIREPSVRGHYEAFVQERVRSWSRPTSPSVRPSRFDGAPRRAAPQGPVPPRVSPSLQLKARRGTMGGTATAPEEMIVLAVLTHPALAVEEAEAIAALPMMDATLASLAGAVIAQVSAHGHGGDLPLDQAALRAAGHGDALDRLLKKSALRCLPATRPEAPAEAARSSLKELIDRLTARKVAATEAAEVRSAFADGLTEESWQRARAIAKAGRGPADQGRGRP